MSSPTPAPADPPASTEDEPAPADPSSGPRWSGQFAVVVALLLGFAALVVAMMILAGGNDLVWQRRVYLFGAVEAIVFTAVGWLFGREVHRSEAQSAKQDAAAAKKETADAQQQASTERDRAADAEQSAVAERVRGDAVRAAIASTADSQEAPTRYSGPAGAGSSRATASGTGPAIDLKSFVDALYRERPED